MKMYTVKELIEALKQCPEDANVSIVVDGFEDSIESVGIDSDNNVTLFGEYHYNE